MRFSPAPLCRSAALIVIATGSSSSPLIAAVGITVRCRAIGTWHTRDPTTAWAPGPARHGAGMSEPRAAGRAPSLAEGPPPTPEEVRPARCGATVAPPTPMPACVQVARRGQLREEVGRLQLGLATAAQRIVHEEMPRKVMQLDTAVKVRCSAPVQGPARVCAP